MAKSDVSNYFKRTSLSWMVVITLAVSYYACVVFAPEVIPYQHLGPFGTFCRYLVDNHAGLLCKGWWAAMAIHVFEGVYALKVCSNKGISSQSARLLWFVQTLLFGYASLGLLMKFNPKQLPKQQ